MLRLSVPRRTVPHRALGRMGKKALPLFGGFLAVAVLTAGCTMRKSELTGDAVDGVVVDATTQQPIPGAMVLLKWRGVLPTVHSNSVPCYHAELATTDAQGRFHTNAWRVETKDHVDWLGYVTPREPPEPVAYKPGYAMPRRYQDDPRRVLLEPFLGTTLERLDYMTGPFDRQLICEADNKTIIPAYQAAYAEAQSIAQTPQELALVDTLLTALESAQYGNSIALDRKAQRRMERAKEAGIEVSR